jgi:hypothetical protein
MSPEADRTVDDMSSKIKAAIEDVKTRYGVDLAVNQVEAGTSLRHCMNASDAEVIQPRYMQPCPRATSAWSSAQVSEDWTHTPQLAYPGAAVASIGRTTSKRKR